MTYLPFLQAQAQCKDNTLMEADRSVTRLEMTRLTDESTESTERSNSNRRSRTDLFPRAVSRSSQPSLLQIAGCLLVLGLAVILSLAVLAVYIFSQADLSQDSDLFNVLLVGGRGEDNSSLLTVELLNIGGCPADTRTDLLIPSLPLSLSHLTVSYLNASNTIAVCGTDSQADWRCFTLRNTSTTWETSLHSVDDEGDGGDGDAGDLSQRHGASVLRLTDRLLLVGGRR